MKKKSRVLRDVRSRCRRFFPKTEAHYEHNRRAWLEAVVYLRTQSKCGWLLDRMVERKAA